MSWDWDVFFRVWAVIGPVAVGAIGAWWARRNTLEDREHEDQINKKRIDDECNRNAIEWTRNRRDRDYQETKTAFKKYLSSCQKYIDRLTILLSADFTDDKHDDHKNTKSEFFDCIAEVVLLGDENIAAVVADLHDATIALPYDQRKGKPDGYEEKIDLFKESRREYIRACREYLESWSSS